MRSIVQSRKKFIVLFLILFGVLWVSSDVFALDTPKPPDLEIAWPTSPNNISLDGNSTLPDLIAYLYGWMIAIGGLAAFSVIVFAGIQYLTSTGDPGKTKDAKDKIASAVGGLLLLLSIVLILNVLNPELTKLTPPGLTPTFQKLTAIDFGEPEDILAECEEVIISESVLDLTLFFNFDIDDQRNKTVFDIEKSNLPATTIVLKPNEKKQNFFLDLEWKPLTFYVKGSCTVSLYTNNDCGGDAAGFLSRDTLGALSLSRVTGINPDDLSTIDCISIQPR